MKRKWQAVFLVCGFVFAGSNALAEKPLTPESLKGVTVVDDAFVKENHGAIKIFDVRDKAEYVEAHIAGARSVPYEEQSEHAVNFNAAKDRLDLSKFPSNKNEAVVVYCNGPRCWKSYKAAVLLIKAGHAKVDWYRAGFPSWKVKGYPVE